MPGDLTELANRFQAQEFAEPVGEDRLTVEHVYLAVEERRRYLDLRPFVNPYCHVVCERTSLTKVYQMFWKLGLRHLLVVPTATEVSGMVTRKDVIRSVAEGP